MPPPHRHPRHHPPPPHHGRSPTSAVAAIIQPDRIERLLEPYVPDHEERAFVVRCMVGEGPIHHRGASYTLLVLLGSLLDRAAPPAPAPDDTETVPVPLRLPPHTAPRDDGDHHYPLQMPLAPLTRLAPKGSPELTAIIDCLLDGPPHHALANAAMVCLIDALLQREAARDDASGKAGG